MMRRLAFSALLLLTSSADAAEQSFSIPIARGRAPQEFQVLRVRQGDVVTLAWRSDRPLVLHLHGYDIEWRVTPGRAAQSTFTASASGRFPIETHGAPGHDHTLLYLEVQPN